MCIRDSLTAGDGDLVPLLLPRSYEVIGQAEDWPPADGVATIPPIDCAAYSAEGTRTVYACDERLYNSLEMLVGSDLLNESICLQDATNLLAACQDDSGLCGLINVEISSTADEEMYDYLTWNNDEPNCEGNEAQQITRSIWSRERILQSRELVVEYECERLFGFPCDAVTDDILSLIHISEPTRPY